MARRALVAVALAVCLAGAAAVPMSAAARPRPSKQLQRPAAAATTTTTAAAAAAAAAPGIEVRHSVHPESVVGLTQADLRRHFLVENLFTPGRVSLTYSHDDRMIIGGASPAPGSPLPLPSGPEVLAKAIGQPSFLAQREMGVFNAGGAGRVVADGETFALDAQEAIYIPQASGPAPICHHRGTKDVRFESTDAAHPAKFYLLSCPAHARHAAAKINARNATKAVSAGSAAASNARTLYHLIVPGGIESDQLTLGVTHLANGSVWNTMPAHLHDRRSEVYMYYGLAPDARVIHLLGEPSETRHLVVANEQAVIEPSWSIHSGAGTSAYSFVWGMCGENRALPDVEPVAMAALR
ncbi:5-dehydro-4-deoxy-D-glucuronate isomerase [Raphidocelis subcapitata]|uniref:5-dehydro-4-deoxy-D-glucuronate isomerase n=1 Tax=Raphidocelis subcapitata TaxID=307507 RepID=A0A2V0P2G8_9CHLO|nr:5-dehydro-4-deoxy-D-glucuronate isomerase [Raphidocelis subcapitata]|eukprot:GBF92040.1 5-dehydro-4-deoxy-D-glucuronate isomerase [Raphidocelis subcapitata]